jgi:type II secretory ATPase GspE/PulE/Tfp pilus assembly ATPase PilB-like protein
MAVLKTESENKKVDNINVLKKELEFSKRLVFITNKINASRDIDDILINLRESILGLFAADRLTIYVVDGANKEIVSRFKTGTEINEIRVPISNTSLAGYCATSGKMANIVNAYDEGELKRINSELTFDRSWDEKTGYKTKQVLVAPIKFKKYLLGVIQLVNKVNGKYFSLEDQKNVTEIAQVLGIAFYNHRKVFQRGKATKFDYLISNNIVSRKNLEDAMALARAKRDSAENVLIHNFSVAKEEVGKSLSAFYNARFIAYDEKMIIPGRLLKGLRPRYLKDNLFVPAGESDSRILIAMENPDYLPAQDAVKRLLPGRSLEFCIALKEDIIKMIDLFFNVQTSPLTSDSGSIEDILGQLESGEDAEDLGDPELGEVSEEDGAIVRLVSKTIIDAYNRGASDVHIEPRLGKADAVIRFRVDGACHVYQTLPYTYKNAVCSRIKIMADLDIAERRLPQDGKIKFRRYGPLDIELRVASIPTTGKNEDIVMRLLPSGEPMPLDQMGMSDRTFADFVEVIQRPYGIVLCVGPTGSGKTTTLHSALRYINKPETKIWTAEDPVEITQDGLRQVQVHPKIGLNFASAMRAFLRADPDVIMVGEMRDKETVSTGIEASLTGHLVFSTLHTNSAPETITRLLDMGMDPFNFADALLGILAQRLVRTLCPDCKEEYHPSRDEFDSLVRAYDGDFDALNIAYNDDLVLYRAKGCSKCQNIGYKGRTGIHELLVANDEMKSLIQVRAPMAEIRKQAIANGMTTLMQDGIRKVLTGQTDMRQVRRVCM